MLVAQPDQTSKIELTETNEIKLAYNDMYLIVCKDIWDFPVVEALADVEIEAYKVFPDLDALRQKTAVLKSEIRQDAPEAEDALEAVDIFQETIDKMEQIYLKLKAPREVLQ